MIPSTPEVTMRVPIAFIALALLGPASAAPAQGRLPDERPIRAVITATGAALNARDWDAAAAVFTEDADVILPVGPRTSGRAAIRALWQRGWGGAPAERRIALTVR